MTHTRRRRRQLMRKYVERFIYFFVKMWVACSDVTNDLSH